MRILQIMAGAGRGGAETYFVHLVAALQNAGFDQKVVIRAEAARAAALKSAGIAPVELRFGGLFDFTTGPALKRILADFQPQVALTWMGRASHLLPSGPYRHIGRLGGYYDLKFFRRCHHLVCNTQDLVRYCTDAGWPAMRVHYVPNFARFQPAAPEPRARWQTPEGQPLLLALGRLQDRKSVV